MSDLESTNPGYPMLLWLVQHGKRTALVGAVVIAGAAAIVAYFLSSIALLVLGGVIAVLAYFAMRVLVELVTLITDMLMPK